MVERSPELAGAERRLAKPGDLVCEVVLVQIEDGWQASFLRRRRIRIRRGKCQAGRGPLSSCGRPVSSRGRSVSSCGRPGQIPAGSMEITKNEDQGDVGRRMRASEAAASAMNSRTARGDDVNSTAVALRKRQSAEASGRLRPGRRRRNGPAGIWNPNMRCNYRLNSDRCYTFRPHPRCAAAFQVA